MCLMGQPFGDSNLINLDPCCINISQPLQRILAPPLHLVTPYEISFVALYEKFVILCSAQVLWSWNSDIFIVI